MNAARTNREVAERIILWVALFVIPATMALQCFSSFLQGGMEKLSTTIFIWAFITWYIWIPALLLGITWAMIGMIAGLVWLLEILVGLIRRHLYHQTTRRA